MIKKVLQHKVGDTFIRNGIHYVIIEFITRSKVKAQEVGTDGMLIINLKKI